MMYSFLEVKTRCYLDLSINAWHLGMNVNIDIINGGTNSYNGG